ncbi:MAG: protease modulator HflC [Rhodospirillaceae bacterium]|nr:protease modulator HflC [Rhodospirillaceae bacterium]
MSIRLAVIGVVVVLSGVLLSDSFFVVSETQQALVLRFGNPQREPINQPGRFDDEGNPINEAGLHFKVPFIDDVVYYERRILEVDPPAEEVTLRDQRRLVVDAFIRYRISDPLLFLQRVRTEGSAVDRLTTILNAALRNVLARYEQSDLLSSDIVDVRSQRRNQIMQEIQNVVARGLPGELADGEEAVGASDLGITIIDVRIGRADVPDQTRESIFTRMRSEREREAGEIRATGRALEERFRAFADRWRVGFLARAQRLSQIIRGEGDQNAIATLAAAHGLDPNFFSFYRTLEAYRAAMANGDTSLVLSPDGDFFRFFQQVSGGGSGSQLESAPLDEGLQEEIRRRLIPSETLPMVPEGGGLMPESITPDAGTPPEADGAMGDGAMGDGETPGDGTDADTVIPTDVGSIDQELRNAMGVPGDLQGLVGEDTETAIDAELSDVLDGLRADEERLIDPSSNAELFEDESFSEPIVPLDNAPAPDVPVDPIDGTETSN